MKNEMIFKDECEMCGIEVGVPHVLVDGEWCAEKPNEYSTFNVVICSSECEDKFEDMCC